MWCGLVRIRVAVIARTDILIHFCPTPLNLTSVVNSPTELQTKAASVLCSDKTPSLRNLASWLEVGEDLMVIAGILLDCRQQQNESG